MKRSYSFFISLFIVFGAMAQVPTFDATWLDQNADGNIDQLRLDFSEAVDFIDLNGPGQPFDAISITGGIVITGPTIDFSTVLNDTSYTFDVSGVTGTASPAVTITYNQFNQNSILSVANGIELADGSTPTQINDEAAPVVSSINRKTGEADPTNAGSVIFTVTFSEDVSDVEDTDFSVTSTGTITGASVSVFGPSATLGSAIDVSVSTGTGDGTIRLDFVTTGDNVSDGSTIIVASGKTGDQVFTLDRTTQTPTLAAPTGTDDHNLDFDFTLPELATATSVTITFTEAVDGETPMIRTC